MKGLGPLLIGIEGLALSTTSRAQLSHPLVGGVVLFSRNFESRTQIESLVGALRDVREPRLLLAVDQEGGRVQRFHHGFAQLPALGRIGKICSQDQEEALAYAYWHGKVMATDILGVGIDLSFAPVLDLDRSSEVIGDRAFSHDPELVIELGRAYLAGMHDSGMKTTGKHFPGHGSVRADSHVADAIDGRSLSDIEASDLRPFEKLAPDLDAMMIAHVVYSSVEPLPAGYSPTWLRQYLRQRIGFRGVIFSDDLGMQAAKSLGNIAARTRAAVDAGCDAALVCMPEDVSALLSAWSGDSDFAEGSLPLETLYGAPVHEHFTNSAELVRWRKRLENLC